MIKTFLDEQRALAVAHTLGLFITKKNDVYIVGNDKSEIYREYHMKFLEEDCIFYDLELFYTDEDDLLRISNDRIVDASNLELPYGITECSHIFEDCKHLRVPPKLPQTAIYCICTFAGCSSLEQAPEIPKGVVDCECMFDSCENLKYPPIIPNSVKDCSFMFEGCKNLRQKPIFPAEADVYCALDHTPFDCD